MAIQNWRELTNPNTNIAEPTGVRHKIWLIPEGTDIPPSLAVVSNEQLGRELTNRALDIDRIEVHAKGLDFDPLTDRYGVWIEYTPYGNSFLGVAALVGAIALLVGAATWSMQTIAVIHGNVEREDLPGLPGGNLPGDFARLGVVAGILFLLWIGRPLLQAGADAGAAALGGE